MTDVAERAGQSGGAATKKAPGGPVDAGSAFLKAATQWPPPATADPDVATAFDLGWQLELASAPPPPAPPGDGFGPPAPSELTGRRMGTCVARLADRLVLAGLEPAAFQADLLDAGRRAGALAALYGADPPLGKAVELGRRLQAMTGRGERVLDALLRHADRVDTLLVDLASALPPCGAHAVRNSLRLWRVAAETPPALEHPERGADELCDQGLVWRQFLAGELAPKDVLHTSDYIGTTVGVVRRVRAMWREARRVWRVAAIAVAVLVVAGVALFVVAGSGDDTAAVAGATSVLAALGLTWKAIGEFFGRQAAKGEMALWDAELDWTIAYRSTRNAWSLEPDDFGRRLRRLRTGPTTAMKDLRDRAGRHEYDHVVRWLTWKRDWPDVETAWDTLRGATGDRRRR